MLNRFDFVDFLNACEARHDGYIMCAIGQDPKKLSEWYYSGQYKGAQLEQAYRWREQAERVWDCQGMADGYVSEMLGKGINVRARNNYASWCEIKGTGDIPAERRVPGAAVFMDNGSYVHHVGFLTEPVDLAEPDGDWYVIEARGVMYGVVRTRLSERRWNKWGWMTKYFEYPAVTEAEPDEYGARLLRRGMSGDDVRGLQVDLIALGYSCGKWGADGDFGRATESALKALQKDHALEVDGVAGPETYGKLAELLPEGGDLPEAEEPVKSIQITAGKTWYIRTQPSAKGRVLGIAKRGEMYAGSGMTAEGWLGILANGEPAWISEKAVGK